MKNECECGSILERSETDFKGIKGIPCWKCLQCGAEFFDSEQVEILDKHITELVNQHIGGCLDEVNESENDEP